MSVPSYDPKADVDDEAIEYHPATEAILRYFEFAHLPGPLLETSRACAHLAFWMAAFLPQGPELTVGLRKLLEAKDAFVRQALELDREGQR